MNTQEKMLRQFGRAFGEMMERKRDKKVLAAWDASQGITIDESFKII